MAHLRHRLCWQGRITTGLENISRQMGQISCFSRLSMLCASPNSGLKPTVKFIPSAIVPTLALACSHCLWTLPRVLSTVFRLFVFPSVAHSRNSSAMSPVPSSKQFALSLDSCFQTLPRFSFCSVPWPGTCSFFSSSLPEWLCPWKFLLLFPKPLLSTLWAVLFVSHSPERR